MIRCRYETDLVRYVKPRNRRVVVCQSVELARQQKLKGPIVRHKQTSLAERIPNVVAVQPPVWRLRQQQSKHSARFVPIANLLEFNELPEGSSLTLNLQNAA